MTVVVEPNQESSEYYNEIVSVLSERIRRCGSCQISSDSLKNLIKRRTGLSGQAARYVRENIIERFLSENLITVWDQNHTTKVFQINVNEWRSRFGTN